MRILSVFTLFLIRNFNITSRDYSYRHLMLTVSLLISTLGFFAFSIKSFSNYSMNLAYVLAISSVLNLANLVFLKLKSNFTFSSYLFIVSFLLTMSYLVFDSGRNGFGFIWFYTIPVVNISILGVRKGTIFSFAFLLFLFGTFLIPSYYIGSDFYPELKPRLLISLFVLILLILFREWTVDFFKKKRLEEIQLMETNFERKKTAILKLSNQIRYVTDEILNSIKHIKTQNPKSQVLKPLDYIYDSSLNLINIINGIGKISELNIRDNEEEDYTLRVELENTVNLFNSYKIDITINIDRNIPVVIHGNVMIIKQVVYNIIENFINSSTENINKIDLNVYKGEESWDALEIKYQLVNLLVKRDIYDQNKLNCQQTEIYPVDHNTADIEAMGLKSILSLIGALNGGVFLNKTKHFISLCFNQKLIKDNHFNNTTISESYKGNSTEKTVASEDLSNKNLNKMRVLLMEDNPMTQKTIMFTLSNVVKKLDIASNGKEGLDLFNIHKYDLILLDMNMPVLNGYEVARRIRNIEQGTRFHIPIIAVISDFLTKDVENIMASGVDEHLHKPLKVSELVNKINFFVQKNKKAKFIKLNG